MKWAYGHGDEREDLGLEPPSIAAVSRSISRMAGDKRQASMGEVRSAIPRRGRWAEALGLAGGSPSAIQGAAWHDR